MSTHIRYRKITQYKYQVMETCSFRIGIQPREEIFEPKPPVKTYIHLSKEGMLTISEGYAWDGPSGPTIDTKNFMRGSLVHDALYQLIRQKALGMEDRLYADQLLRRMCRTDGMSMFRAWIVYLGVLWFGASSARPKDKKDVVIIDAP
ncbi:MAG: DUF1353 domain-containing protein [Ignavibacteriales bacterium]|nr:DUF1353 domain-containing protein [Ignavibacteriales bacterium]